MNYINKFSPVNKTFRISSDYEGNSFIEVPSLYDAYLINLSSDKFTLSNIAKVYNHLGILGFVDSDSGMESYLNAATKLDAVIQHLELHPEEEILFACTITVHAAKYESSPERVGMFFQLDVNSEEEIPILLPELVDSMTEFLMMFNHRLLDSGICLN